MFWCLPWYTPHSERIKLQSCRNLIQYYLGDFLEEKLTLDQLSINFYNGTGSVSDITLDCEALNALGNKLKWPVEITDGRMDDITVSIPWSNLFKEDSVFKVKGLSVTVQPKVRPEPVMSILKWIFSNWSTWASPKRFLMGYKQEHGLQSSGRWESPGQGAEMFAESIDSILKRLKVKFEDTKIKIEHVPKDTDRGIALDIYIKNIDYYSEPVTNPVPLGTGPEHTKTYILDTYISKKVKFEGITIYTETFPTKQNTTQGSLLTENSLEPQNQKETRKQTTVYPDVFQETDSDMPAVKSNTVKDVVGAENFTEFGQQTLKASLNQSGPVLFAALNGQQELTLTLKRINTTEGPKVEGQTFGPFIVVLSPQQLDSVIELINSLKHPEAKEKSKQEEPPPDANIRRRQYDYELLFAIT